MPELACCSLHAFHAHLRLGRVAHYSLPNRALAGESLLPALRKEFADFLVSRLLELLVPHAHAIEGGRPQNADDLIHLRPNGVAGFRWSNRHAHDQATWRLPLEGQNACAHRGAGRKAIIDEDDYAAANLRVRVGIAITLLALSEDVLLTFNRGLDCRWVDSEAAHNVVVKNADAAGGNRAHGKLFMARDAQLAHQEDIERSGKGTGYLVRNRDTTSGKCQNEEICFSSIGCQRIGKSPARISTIVKTHLATDELHDRT
jgi:hypothetical protein